MHDTKLVYRTHTEDIPSEYLFCFSFPVDLLNMIPTDTQDIWQGMINVCGQGMV